MPILIEEGKEYEKQKDFSKLRNPLKFFPSLEEYIIFRNCAILATLHDDRKVMSLYRGGKELQFQNDHKPWSLCDCSFAQKIRERNIEVENLRLSGTLKDMTYEDFIEIHNMSRSQFKERVQETVLNWIFLENKPSVLDGSGKLSSEELQSRIWALERFREELQVQISKDKIELADFLETAEEEEKEEIRKRDKEYEKKRQKRLKETPKEEPTKVTVRLEEKMIQNFMALGMTRDEAQKAFIDQRAAVQERKERKEPESKEDKMLRGLMSLGMTMDQARVALIEKKNPQKKEKK